MGHLQAYRAAADGKRRANKFNLTSSISASIRRLIVSAAVLLMGSVFGTASYAQSGPFSGMAGAWSGGGTVTLDDGSTERIRCRATYAVGNGGAGLNQSLTCASDSYRFVLASNVIAQGSSLSGTWSEATRNVSGNLEGRGANGSFEVVASAPGFTANIALATRGNRQTISIRSQSVFRAVNMTLSRS